MVARRVKGGALAFCLVVLLLVVAPAGDLGGGGGGLVAATPVGAVDPAAALSDADPIVDGPPPLGALVAGALLLVGLAVSARRRA